MNFTNDEMNLMCIYDTGDRMGTLKALGLMNNLKAQAEETILAELILA